MKRQLHKKPAVGDMVLERHARHLLEKIAVNLRLRSEVLAVVPRTRWGGLLGTLVTPHPTHRH